MGAGFASANLQRARALNIGVRTLVNFAVEPHTKLRIALSEC